MKIKVISCFVAEWALPNEGIPLFLLWKGKLDFDLIKIKIPESIVIREYYNIAKKYPNPNEIHFDELKTLGYFGLVLTSPITEQTSKEIEIVLNFLKGSKIIYRHEFKTRIVRPKIELHVPEKVEMSPSGEMKMEVKLRYTGYGNTYAKIMVSKSKEQLVFNVKDFRDLFLVMTNAHTFKQFMKKNNILEKEFIGSEIPIDQYKYRMFLLENTQLEDFTPKHFFDALGKIVENKKMRQILEKTIEESKDIATNLFNSIIDFVEKRPVEGVFLSDRQIESVELSTGKSKLFVCIGYVDDFGNHYSETKSVPIVLQKKRIITFDQKWEEKSGDWSWLQTKQ